MSDNLKNRGPADRRLLSSQPHEIGHVISKYTKANSDLPRDQVVKQIFKARDQIAPSESRAKFTQQVEKNINRLR
jgi:hypothetical protein